LGLRSVLSGAAPLGADAAKLCQDRISCRVVQGYGLTEASPCTHLTSDDDRSVPQGSVGKALPGTECRVVDVVTGADLGPGDDGELLIRGPQIMAGYLNNAEATDAVLDTDGFLHTGDIVRIDADGNLFIVDRLKELIKHKGFQIAPAELEAVLLTHEDVADAAVIGYPDERAGEVPKAFVVVKPGRAVEADDLRKFVSERVASYKEIAYVEFIDAIPHTASGKIQRRLLRETASAGRAN
jgi:acyl-CoA synthetase (AMP-forming)/AMP-acid ligase II